MKNFFSVPVIVLIFGLLAIAIAFSYDDVVKKYQSSIIKDLLVETRAQAQTYFLRQSPQGYTASTMLTPGLPCTGDMFEGNFPNNLESTTGSASVWPNGTTLSCQATSLQYAVSALLPVGEGGGEDLNVWCVDSTGRSMWINNHLVQGDTNCN
jgi:hypothetical protein